MTGRELDRLIADALAGTEEDARLRHPAGLGVPMSPEVRQHVQDLEAVELANSWRIPPPSPPRPVWDQLVSFFALAGLFLVIALTLAGLTGWGA